MSAVFVCCFLFVAVAAADLRAADLNADRALLTRREGKATVRTGDDSGCCNSAFNDGNRVYHGRETEGHSLQVCLDSESECEEVACQYKQAFDMKTRKKKDRNNRNRQLKYKKWPLANCLNNYLEKQPCGGADAVGAYDNWSQTSSSVDTTDAANAPMFIKYHQMVLPFSPWTPSKYLTDKKCAVVFEGNSITSQMACQSFKKEKNKPYSANGVCLNTQTTVSGVGSQEGGMSCPVCLDGTTVTTTASCEADMRNVVIRSSTVDLAMINPFRLNVGHNGGLTAKSSDEGKVGRKYYYSCEKDESFDIGTSMGMHSTPGSCMWIFDARVSEVNEGTSKLHKKMRTEKEVNSKTNSGSAYTPTDCVPQQAGDVAAETPINFYQAVPNRQFVVQKDGDDDVLSGFAKDKQCKLISENNAVFGTGKPTSGSRRAKRNAQKKHAGKVKSLTSEYGCTKYSNTKEKKGKNGRINGGWQCNSVHGALAMCNKLRAEARRDKCTAVIYNDVEGAYYFWGNAAGTCVPNEISDTTVNTKDSVFSGLTHMGMYVKQNE